MIELIISRSPAGMHPPIELRRGESATLGREALADYAFNGDAQMSTVHLTVLAFDRHLEFIDEASTNGTFLNGVRAVSGQAADGDELRIGQTEFLVRVHSEAKTSVQQLAPAEPIASRSEPGPEHDFAKPLDEVLEIEADDGSVRLLEPNGTLSIGRTLRSNWVFPDDQLMSSLHCILNESQGTWEVIDSHSSNGTFLNGRRIEKAVIDDGDELKVGNSRFTLRLCRRSANEHNEATEATFNRPAESFPTLYRNDNAPESPSPHSKTSQPCNRVEAPQEQGLGAVPYEALWLFPRQSNVAPICILRGGAITIGSASIAAGVGEPTEGGIEVPIPQVVLQWHNNWGEFSVWPATANVRRNDFAASQGVLTEGDTLELGNTIFDVTYQTVTLVPPATDALFGSSPEQTCWPATCEPSTFEESVAEVFVDDDLAAVQASAAPSTSDETLAPELENEDCVAVKLAVPDGNCANGVAEVAVKNRSLLVDESLVANSSACGDVAHPANSDACMLAKPDVIETEAIASSADVVNQEPRVLMASDLVTGAVNRLEGRLPNNDLIGALYRLAAHDAVWLLEVDSGSGQCISLPFRISTEDAAWMLAVQASWPRNNYLIVFSDADANADQVIEAVSTVQDSQTDRRLSSEGLALAWDTTAPQASLLSRMRGFMLVEGTESLWRFFGAFDRLPDVSNELKSWT